MAVRALVAVGLAAVGTVGLAQAAPDFLFDPKPRWSEEAETAEVCQAIAAECPGSVKDGEIEAVWGYAELYDSRGKLVGLRSERSTGCKALDEHLLLGHRGFRTTFSKPDQSDLDGITVELAPGTRPDAVRLVKRGETNVGIGC